ncbi:MAG: hypothetical protein ACI8ZM_003863 [Crocinitomix sp.]|jgi:hypothetical protein
MLRDRPCPLSWSFELPLRMFCNRWLDEVLDEDLFFSVIRLPVTIGF